MDGLNLQYLTSHSFFVNYFTQSAFWVLDQFLWCNYSNETSSVLLSHGTIYLLITFSVCEQYAMVRPFFSSIFTWNYLLLALLKYSLVIQLNFDFCRFWDYWRIGFVFPGGLLFWSRSYTTFDRETLFLQKEMLPHLTLKVPLWSEREVHVPTPGYLINLSVISWLMTDLGSSTAKAR